MIDGEILDILKETEEALLNMNAGKCYNSGDHPCNCTPCKLFRIINKAIEQSLFDKNGIALLGGHKVKLSPCGIGFEDELFVAVHDDFGIPNFIHPERFGVSISFEDYFLRNPNRSRRDFEIVFDNEAINENPELL